LAQGYGTSFFLSRGSFCLGPVALVNPPAMAQRAPFTLRCGRLLCHCADVRALEEAASVFMNLQPEEHLHQHFVKYESFKSVDKINNAKTKLHVMGHPQLANHLNRATVARHFLAHPRPDLDAEVMRQLQRDTCSDDSNHDLRPGTVGPAVSPTVGCDEEHCCSVESLGPKPGSWERLPDAAWTAVYGRFPRYRRAKDCESTRQHKVLSQARRNALHQDIDYDLQPNDRIVSYHGYCGVFRRRGYGIYGNECRVQYDGEPEIWADSKKFRQA